MNTTDIAALRLLQRAEAAGFTMQIGRLQLKHADAAWLEVEATGEERVRFYTDGGKTPAGWAFLMAPGPLTCAPDETIVDHSTVGPLAMMADQIFDELEAASA